MNWQDLTVGKRIGSGFGFVILLLLVLGLLSFSGVGGIVNNASEVIDGKALDGILAQKEVDHLNWAGAVNKLITDQNVHTLKVQLDHTQCGFGKWLYGEGRKQAESLVPELAPLLKDIEKPHQHLHDSAIRIKKEYARADSGLPEFIARKEIDHLNWTALIQNAIIENKNEIDVQTDHTKCGFGKWLYGEKAAQSAELDTDLARLLEEINTPPTHLHSTAIKLIQAYKMTHPGLLDTLRVRLDDHRKWVASVSDAILEKHGSLTVQMDHTKCGFGRWLYGEEARALGEQSSEFKKILDEVDAPHKSLHASAMKIDSALRNGEFEAASKLFRQQSKAHLEKLVAIFGRAINLEYSLESGRNEAIRIFKEETLPQLTATRKVLRKIGKRADNLLQGYHTAASVYANETAPALHNVQALLGKLRSIAKDNILTDQAMLSAANGTKRNVAIISIVALVAGILLAFVIARGIIHVLSSVTSNLDEGADQVAAASGQISSSSQSLAEGASQQAASLEETSSSLEEMSSMTKQNAENASHADTLSKESSVAVNESMASMSELTRSMEEISKASEETSKIIKTIDEIAFQTNLLALNAAVEAARAGEAGAGFAVVADEVRNLAMRAANAAKDTSELIESTTTKVAHGAGLVEKTNADFKKVEENTSKVAELVGEISAASREQSDGIEQVNMAVSEMDKVTQQNAANAEESASASEEMNAQASQMKSMVDELVKIVGSSSGNGAVKPGRNIKQIASLRASGSKVDHTESKDKLEYDKRKREVRPEQVIPFEEDEDDFKDF